MMKKNRPAYQIDVAEFARMGKVLDGKLSLQEMPRLANLCVQPLPDEMSLETPVASWHVQGELKSPDTGESQVWLHLHMDAQVPLRCQRCLKSCLEAVQVDLSYRFVATEEQAIAEDAQSQEDVLALTKWLDIAELCEDELIMALPVVALHEICPDPLIPGLDHAGIALEVGDADDMAGDPADEKPNPFAALKDLLQKPH